MSVRTSSMPALEIKPNTGKIIPMKQAWLLLDQWLSQRSKRQIALIVFVLVTFLGWLDYTTGFEISFSFFYLLPIGITAWYLGFTPARWVTALSIFLWAVTNRLAGEVYSSEWIRIFNTGVRLLVFIAIARLLHELRLSLHHERAIARTDYLTGIYNRRVFYEQLELELKRASRLHYPVSFAYIDLDNFKQVNDQFGHSAGDDTLKLIADTLLNSIRETDLFARLGGDEFGLFLPNTDQKQAEIVLKKVNQAATRLLKKQNSPVSLSVGVVTFPTAPANADFLIQQADEMMYQAKDKGKSRITYFTATDSPSE